MRPSFVRFAAGLLALLAADPSFAQVSFDLSPEQPGRLHAEPVQGAIQAIPKDFPFAQPGKLTIAVNPSGGPPIATYATDAETVIGSDPDYARLVAETLGLELDLVPVAEPKDIAGLRVIVGVGTNQERILLEWDRRNTEAGLKPAELQYSDDEATSLVALRSGRADVIVQPFPLPHAVDDQREFAQIL